MPNQSKQSLDTQQEKQLLEQYAAVSKRKILSSQSDLSPKDRAMPSMVSWCRRQKHIVVLHDGKILTNHPGSRLVQNCKIVMLNQGLEPGDVYPAAQSLINILLENAEDPESLKEKRSINAVSTQQKRLRMLVKEALDVGASDIHVEIRTKMARIRFRKDGELYLHAEWLSKLAREVVSVAFNKETDHAVTYFNPLVPQNASMPLEIDGTSVRLRLASLPAHQGFDVVMRLLAIAQEETQTLAELGYMPKQVAMFRKAIHMPSGVVVLAGPTGSGKTTTLASCMQLVSDRSKLYTIEDPVEKIIFNATQVPVNTEHYDRSFASMARTTLRMDPDVLVLGEIRDEDTAAVVMRAAMTGHLVFSTVHANSAPAIVPRLADLGISYSLMSTPGILLSLICQRLAPKLCEHCAKPLLESDKYKEFIPRWKEVFGKDIKKIKARGDHKKCSHCRGLGISDRTVVAEIIWIDEMGRQFIQKQDMLGWQQYLKENGWHTYQTHVLNIVKAGICDPFDAERLMGEISPVMDLQTFNYNNV